MADLQKHLLSRKITICEYAVTEVTQLGLIFDAIQRGKSLNDQERRNSWVVYDITEMIRNLSTAHGDILKAVCGKKGHERRGGDELLAKLHHYVTYENKDLTKTTIDDLYIFDESTKKEYKNLIEKLLKQYSSKNECPILYNKSIKWKKADEIIPFVKCNKEGTPIIKDLFSIAQKRAKYSTNQVIEEIFKTLEDKLDDPEAEEMKKTLDFIRKKNKNRRSKTDMFDRTIADIMKYDHVANDMMGKLIKDHEENKLEESTLSSLKSLKN